MILRTNHNTPVAAPQFSNMTAILAVYCRFMDNSVLQLSDLVTFVTSPSPEREEFLQLLTVECRTMNNKYIKQIYSVPA